MSFIKYTWVLGYNRFDNNIVFRSEFMSISDSDSIFYCVENPDFKQNAREDHKRPGNKWPKSMNEECSIAACAIFFFAPTFPHTNFLICLTQTQVNLLRTKCPSNFVIKCSTHCDLSAMSLEGTKIIGQLNSCKAYMRNRLDYVSWTNWCDDSHGAKMHREDNVMICHRTLYNQQNRTRYLQTTGAYYLLVIKYLSECINATMSSTGQYCVVSLWINVTKWQRQHVRHSLPIWIHWVLVSYFISTSSSPVPKVRRNSRTWIRSIAANVFHIYNNRLSLFLFEIRKYTAARFRIRAEMIVSNGYCYLLWNGISNIFEHFWMFIVIADVTPRHLIVMGNDAFEQRGLPRARQCDAVMPLMLYYFFLSTRVM